MAGWLRGRSSGCLLDIVSGADAKMTDNEAPACLCLVRSSEGVRRLAGIAAAAALFQLVSAFAALSSMEGAIEAAFLSILVTGTFVAVAATIYFATRLASKRPILVIGTDGILDRTSLASVGLLHWEEIVGVEPRAVGTEPFVLIRTNDPDAVVARQRWLMKRLLLRMSARMGYGVAAITVNVLPISGEQVIHAIEEWLKVKQAEQPTAAVE